MRCCFLVRHPPLGERTGVWRDADRLSAHPGNAVGRIVWARALLELAVVSVAINSPIRQICEEEGLPSPRIVFYADQSD